MIRTKALAVFLALIATTGIAAGAVATDTTTVLAQEDGQNGEAEAAQENETDGEAETDDEATAGLTVDSLTAPESATPGSNVSVVAVVANDGDERVTEPVEFRVGGGVVDRQFVTVEEGETEVVTLSANTTGLEPGTYTHAVFTPTDGEVAEITLSESFALESLSAPETATAGDEITVEASVSNPNDFETTQNVTFRLGGTPLAEEEVTLDGGEADTVTFDVPTEGLEPGTYTHGVFTRDDGQFAEITVEEAAEETATVTFEDQESDGTTVTVEEVNVSDGGYVAIHDETLLDGDAVGSVVGVSEYLEPGEYEDLEVELFDVEGAEFNESELSENQTLIAMAHLETTGDETYDFVASSGEDDGPYVDEDGDPVTDDAEITVEAEANATAAPANVTDEPENVTEGPENATDVFGNDTEEPANLTNEPENATGAPENATDGASGAADDGADPNETA